MNIFFFQSFSDLATSATVFAHIRSTDGSTHGVFNMQYYGKSPSTVERLTKAFEIVNNFFASLTEEEQQAFAEFYHDMAGRIETEIPINIQQHVYRLLSRVNLPERLIEFVKQDKNIIYSTESEIRDYLKDHLVHLTALTLLSKLFAPIWGHTHIHVLEKAPEGFARNDGLRIFAMEMLQPILTSTHFDSTWQQWKGFLNTHLEIEVKSWTINQLDAFYKTGRNLKSLLNRTQDYLLVYEFVKVNVYAEYNNLPAFISKYANSKIRVIADQMKNIGN
jgi:hypothetical protein